MHKKDKSLKRMYLARVKRIKQNTFGIKNYTPHGKMENRIWKFTIGDADDHPSIPHAHAKETGERLNPWTGEIYQAGNKRTQVIGRVRSKELNRLHSDPKFIEFARKQIEWYRKT